MPPLPTIACKECGHVNEGERVYCHNCGNKLDRSILVIQQQKKNESAEQRRQRVLKMLNPNSGLPIHRILRETFKTLLYAALAAILIDAALPPQDVPPMPKTKLVDLVPGFETGLENLVSMPAGQKLFAPEDQINAYLKNHVRARKDTDWLASLVEFQRVFANLGNNTYRLTVQNAVYGYPLYAGITYSVRNQSNTVTVVPTGANLGRLSIHPDLARYTTGLLQSIFDALKHERELLERSVAHAEVEKGGVTIVARGPTAPQP